MYRWKTGYRPYSRLDIQFNPVYPIGHSPRRDLTDIGEYHQYDRDGSKDTSSRYTMFSSHLVDMCC
jgi:hypothetical protein